MERQASFGDLLREHRLAAGLTQDALAVRSGLSADAISLLERGVRRSPRPRTIAVLARALSRLALELAARLVDDYDGVVPVALAPVRSAELVAQTGRAGAAVRRSRTGHARWTTPSRGSGRGPASQTCGCRRLHVKTARIRCRCRH